MQPLNSPIELGVRSVVILAALYPSRADLNRLVLMDHVLLHSADLGGPESIIPPVPARAGELGVKRTVVEHGLRVMMRAGMVNAFATAEGLQYAAAESAGPFLELLDSSHLQELRELAQWVAGEFSGLDEAALRNRISDVMNAWSEELDIAPSWEAVLEQEDAE